jgi:hypothetical protein
MKRPVLALALACTASLTLVPVVAAGEWSPGRGEHNGSSGHAASECVYNGHDDNDADDNALWAMTPAGGRVQSGGQLVAIGFVDPGVQGFACNPQRSPR